jgi:hypothetical protein
MPIKKIVFSNCWDLKNGLDARCKNSSCVFDDKVALKDTQLEVFYLDPVQLQESILVKNRLC